MLLSHCPNHVLAVEYALIYFSYYMPILWWYLLKNFTKVLLLSFFSFIAILLVSRLEEIAQFATFGAPPFYLLCFVFYQIPYLLPIALPISCLISSILLFQRLSHSYELTALRAGGIGLLQTIAPILWAAFLLSIANFYIASEIATTSHLATRRMVYELSSFNPLLLLQNAKIARLKEAFVQMEPIRNGEAIGDIVIALKNRKNQRINLLLAKQAEMKNDMVAAKQVSLVLNASTKGDYDHLIIENQHWSETHAFDLLPFLRGSGWRLANDHLSLKLLRIQLQELRNKNSKGAPLSSHYRKCQSEIIRRFALGLSAFSFTLIGIGCGMGIGRNFSRKRISIALILTAATLVSFCIGKSLEHELLISATCFLLPHILMVGISLWTLKQINQGIE